jgi:uncharacterized membrane protein
MDANTSEWLNVLFRWIHLVVGILWIGHLYFFNFVNAQVVKTYDADSKKKVVPELMPRALYWFRWGALYTWVTGLLLAGLVYYHGGLLLNENATFGAGAGIGISLGSMVVAFAVYDLLWKSPLAKKETVGTVVSFLLLAGLLFGLSRVFTGRALYIHLGAIFGTIMAANVWMRIWPSQRKIIAGIKGTSPAPDPSVAALAGLRSKHNTYLSVPLMFSMISNHASTIVGSEHNLEILLGMVLVGWGVAKVMYMKAGTPAPAKY